MATVDFTKDAVDRKVDIITWANLANGDDGLPFTGYLRPDKTIQVVAADFGAGGTIVFEGSNDGTNYATLTDADGNACSFTAEDIVFVREAPVFVRPRVTAGDGSTDITVIMVAVSQGRDW